MSGDPRLLLVDDDTVDRMAIRRALAGTALSADVEEAPGAEEALSALRDRAFDCVIMDYQLPGRTGLELVAELRRIGVDVPVVMLTGQSDPEAAVGLMNAGATDFLPKASLNPNRLEAAIRAAVRLVRTERALRVSQTWASTALRSIGDAVITTDMHGRVTYLNRAAEELTGWTAGRAMGRMLADVADVTPDDGGLPLDVRLAEVVAGRTVVSQGDMALRALGGRRVLVDVRVARIRADRTEGLSPPRQAVGAVLALRDITDRKAAEAALVAARKDAEYARVEAEAANRAKGDFLATMSHELRTPLNAIGGFAQLLVDGIYGSIEARQREALLRIKRAQELLLGLINAVLDFAKVQAGRVPLEVSAFDVQAMLDDVRSLMLPQIIARQLALVVKPLGDARVVAYADRDKVQQIVLNLLSNAIKFTAAGGTITLAWRAAGALAQVLVADTGVGIPAGRREVIFEPFVQLGSDRTTIGQGTGLGLAISRELARSMGGELTVDSDVGLGSTFVLTLPLASALK